MTNTPLKILALDASSKTGWAYFEGSMLMAYGLNTVDVTSLKLNSKAESLPEYPYNIIAKAREINSFYIELIEKYKPTHVVVENTTLSRNRHAQRLLEFIHFVLFTETLPKTSISKEHVKYLNPSEWRSILEIRLTKNDKKKNSDVKNGISKGKITKKHLSVRYVNEKYQLNFLQKDNDIADAIGLGEAGFKIFSR